MLMHIHRPGNNIMTNLNLLGLEYRAITNGAALQGFTYALLQMLLALGDYQIQQWLIEAGQDTEMLAQIRTYQDAFADFRLQLGNMTIDQLGDTNTPNNILEDIRNRITRVQNLRDINHELRVPITRQEVLDVIQARIYDHLHNAQPRLVDQFTLSTTDSLPTYSKC